MQAYSIMEAKTNAKQKMMNQSKAVAYEVRGICDRPPNPRVVRLRTVVTPIEISTNPEGGN
jgi:hypothetical protein